MNRPGFSGLTEDESVRLLASKKNGIEGEAMSRLKKTAEPPDVVAGDMIEAGLIRVVATLKPRITYKVRNSPF